MNYTSYRKIEPWCRAIVFDVVVLFGLWVPKVAWGINSWIIDISGMVLIWWMTKKIVASAYDEP